jgi:cytochrome c oxidase subunit 1
MSNNDIFRVCPDTGLKFHRPAEALMKANAVAAVVFLLIGGIFGLLVGLTRWPEVHMLGAEAFYQALTGHGINLLIFWIIFFEMAVLQFCSSTLLGCRLATPRLGWAAWGLMIFGALANNYAVLIKGNSSVMMTSYVPIPADTWFYVGLILFAVGALINCFIFLATLVIAKDEKTYEGSIPLVTFGALTAAIIAIFTIASGAVILIPTLLWNLGLVSNIDAGVYRLIWWAFGHSSQQINVSAHVAVWYAIAAIVFGAKPMSEKVSRFAFLLYIAVLQIASAHHLLVDPGLSSEWKIFNTSYAMYLAVMASMVHGLTVPGSIEQAQRAKGLNSGLFEWLRKAPWGNPVFSGMFLSLVGFGVLGGITGVVMGAEQINLIVHNTLYVPGHFHGTVVVGTTLAFMALTYWLVPIRPLAALPVRNRHVRSRPVPDGGRYAGRAQAALGHPVLRGAGWGLRVLSGRTHHDEPQRNVGAARLHRGCGVHPDRGWLAAVRPQAGRGAESGPRDDSGEPGGEFLFRHRDGHHQHTGYPGHGVRVLHCLRPVLLHQLEVPWGDLGAELGMPTVQVRCGSHSR